MTRQFSWLAWAVLLAFSWPCLSAAGEIARYRITPLDTGHRVRVEFELAAPQKLTALSHTAPELIERDNLGMWQIAGNTLSGSAMTGGAYTSETSSDWKERVVETVFFEESAYTTDFRDWLWLPPMSAGDWVTITVHNSDALALAVPWAVTKKRGHEIEYRLSPLMLEESGFAAFGRFQHARVSSGVRTLDVYLLASRNEAAAYLAWINNTAQVVWETFGSLPHGAVWVIPTWYGDDAVAHAQVSRGGGNGVLVMPRYSASQKEWEGDWTLFHEFTHWMHPYLGGSGRWVAEGLASYFQYPLLAKAGQIPAATAWRKLAAGFRRGRDQGGNMDRYWRGAVFALRLDIALRKTSRGKDTLAALLTRFGACALPAERRWPTKEFIAMLDGLGAAGSARNEFEASAGKDFPRFETLLREIGVDPETGEYIAVADPTLRDAIMGADATILNPSPNCPMEYLGAE